VLPAISEDRVGVGKTEYYLDSDGSVREIAHYRYDGESSELVVRFAYTRDANGRITEVEEVRPDPSDPEEFVEATTTYTYGSGHLSTSQLDEDSSVEIEADDPDILHYSWLADIGDGHALQAGDPNRLVKERRYANHASLGSSYKKEYWYDPGGNRLAMRVSTAAASEANDVVTSVTRYNYWRMAYDLDDLDNATKMPGTPCNGVSGCDAIAAKDQLLSEQRFDYTDYTASPPTLASVTGTVYEWGRTEGAFNANALTGKKLRRAELVSSAWKPVYERSDYYRYQPFMFMNYHSADWKTKNTSGCVLSRGGYIEQYRYDIFGRPSSRTHNECTDPCAEGSPPSACSCTSQAEEEPPPLPDLDCSTPVEEQSGRHIYYAYAGAAGRIISELGGWARDGSGTVYTAMHATYTPGVLGNAIRTNRSGTLTTTSDDDAIEPLFDAMMNNVAAVNGSAVTFEQSTAFGQLVSSSAVTDLGSFAWRGREGTISFRFNTSGGHPNLFRMGDRANDPHCGRFTQTDRLILDGAGPLSANRYVYALNDPVNFSDPTGRFPVLAALLAVIASGIGFYIGYELGLSIDPAPATPTAFETGCVLAADVGLAGAGIGMSTAGVSAVIAQLSGAALFMGVGASLLPAFIAGVFAGLVTSVLLARSADVAPTSYDSSLEPGTVGLAAADEIRQRLGGSTRSNWA